MLSLAESYNEANIFLGLIEYELNSLLGSSHLRDYISVHIRFDLERYLLIIIYEAEGPIKKHSICLRSKRIFVLLCSQNNPVKCSLKSILLSYNGFITE